MDGLGDYIMAKTIMGLEIGNQVVVVRAGIILDSYYLGCVVSVTADAVVIQAGPLVGSFERVCEPVSMEIKGNLTIGLPTPIALDAVRVTQRRETRRMRCDQYAMA